MDNENYRLMSIDEVNTHYPAPEFLVQDLLTYGGVSILCGRPKHGKSTLIRHLVKSIMHQQVFLGKNVKQGSVLYIQLEEHPRIVTQHLEALGIVSDDSLRFLEFFGKLDVKKKISIIKSIILKDQPSLIIIDPLIRFFDIEDINDFGKVYKEISLILDLARNMSVHISLVHHNNKSGAGNQYSILGSTALAAVVDTMIFIEKGDKCGYVSSEQRYGKGLPDLKLEIADDKIISFQEDKGLTDFEIKSLTLESLKKHPDGLKQDQIVEIVQGRKINVINCLKELESKQQIFSKGTGRKGSPLIYYSQPSNNYMGMEMQLL